METRNSNHEVRNGHVCGYPTRYARRLESDITLVSRLKVQRMALNAIDYTQMTIYIRLSLITKPTQSEMLASKI